MKKITQPLAIEYWITEFIYNLKKKTTLTISDLEAFESKSMNLIIAIEDLRKSRDNWREKCDELKLEVKKWQKTKKQKTKTRKNN